MVGLGLGTLRFGSAYRHSHRMCTTSSQRAYTHSCPTHITPPHTGKGWQGSCARVAEDACTKLPRKLGRGGWGKKGGKGGAGSSSSGGGVGPVMTLLGLGSMTVGVLVMAGLYRREVAGVVAAYAGKDAAEQLEQQLLVPLESGVQQGLEIAGPYIAQLQEVAGPAVASAWEKMGPLVQQAGEQAAPAVAALQQLFATASQQLQEMVAKAKAA